MTTNDPKTLVLNPDIVEKIDNMVMLDVNRNDLFQGIDGAVHSDWDLPPEIDGIFKVVTSDPQDAVRAIERFFKSLKPVYRVEQLAKDIANREVADEMEEALTKIISRAGKRKGDGSVMSSIGWQAAKYAMVAIRVTDVEKEREGLGSLEIETQVPITAKRYGRFAIEVYPAPQVHVRYSKWGAEAVLLAQDKELDTIISEWGAERTSNIKKHFKAAGNDKYKVYDYEELGKRWVYVQNLSYTPGTSKTTGVPDSVNLMTSSVKMDNPDAGHFVIMNGEKTGLDFLPWSVRWSGNTTEPDNRNKFLPMLKSIIDSGQWEVQNILESLQLDRVLQLHYAPKLIQQGMSNEMAEINYDDPTATIAKAPPGSTLTPMSIDSLDPSMLALSDRTANRMFKSTVSEVSLTDNFAANTAAQTVSQVHQQAAGTIKPYMNLVEEVLEDVIFLILAWIIHGKEPHMERVGKGGQFTINPDEVPLEYMEISAVLLPKDSLGSVGDANIASMLLQMGFSKERSYDVAGVPNPSREIEMARQEQMEDTYFAGELMLIENGYQMQVQEMQMQQQLAFQEQQMKMQAGIQQQAQQEAQAQAAAQQQQQQAAGGQGGQPQAANGRGPTPGGQGNDPSVGADSPVNEANTQAAIEGGG